MANGTTFTVKTLDELNAAIAQIDAIGRPGANGGVSTLPYTIKLAADINLGMSDRLGRPLLDAERNPITVNGTTVMGSDDLYALNPNTDVSLTIDGGGTGGQTFAIDGGGMHRGFFAAGGLITLQALQVKNTVAKGGAGIGGTGGGAGLGGGLFVAEGSQVTLSGVSFSGNAATGGAGGAGSDSFTGGGGLGGAGGDSSGGGGGVGASASGATGGMPAGSGILLGEMSGGGMGGAFGGGGAVGSGGGASGMTSPNGGFGGGGALGGDGGFGGGGSVNHGGGFGGGGGGRFGGGTAGPGGYGAGAGNAKSGGGGLGAGGDVFVQQGGILTIADGSLAAGMVKGGAGADATNAGQAFGDGLFIQGNQIVTLAPSAGQTLTISGVIADQTSTLAGQGALRLKGAGTVLLAAANTFSGGSELQAGTFELGTRTSAGTGAITFDTGAQTLRLDTIGIYKNTISNFSTDGDIIDLVGLDPTGATASFDGTKLTVTSGSNRDTLTINAAPSGFQYSLVADTTLGGGTDVVLTAVPPATGGGATAPGAPTPAPVPPTPVSGTTTPAPVTTDPNPTTVTASPTNNSIGAAPADTVSIDQAVRYAGGVFTLTGRASSAAGVAGVEISALIDEGTREVLGAATVNADGSFTFADTIGAHEQTFLVATLTDGAGVTATSADPALSLMGGLHQHSFRAVAYDYTNDGMAETSSSTYRSDGSRRVDVMASDQILTSDFFDRFGNHEDPNNTFVFDPGHGLDVVSGFRVDGTDHDTVSFLGSDFGGSMAEVLRNTRDVGGSAVITDPTSGDTVRLASITRAELKANQGDFAFHA